MTRPSLALMAILSLVSPPIVPGFAADRAVAETQMQTRGLYLQLIHQARADGRPRAAIAYLDDFDRQFPGDLDARILRANALLDLGQIDGAVAVLATIPARSQDSASLNAVRGHVLAARGQWAAAIPCYEAAVRMGPTEPLLRNALGYALLRSGIADRAIEQLRNGVDLAPTDDVIRNNLLLAFVMAGRGADADAMIAGAGDRQAQADLRRLVAAEAARIDRLAPRPISSTKKAG